MKFRKCRSRSSVRQPARSEALFERLEARQLLATITWDGGGDGATLTQATNWTGDVLPGVADDAVINVGGAPSITYASGVAFSVNSLSCAETLSISNGTMTIAAASAFSGAFAMSGGTITGAGGLTISGATFNWSGGQITTTGSGTLTLSGATTSTFAGGTLGINRDTTNDGTVNWTQGNLAGFGGPGITFTNDGTFNAAPSGNNVFSANSSNNTFVNNGTFNKNGAASPSFGGCIFNSTGAVNINTGAMTFSVGGSMSGAMTVAAGTTLTHNGGTFTYAVGATLAGTGDWALSGTEVFNIAFAPGGAVSMAGGTLTLNSANQTIASFAMSGGTITGAGNLTLSSAFSWTGGQMAGSGTLTIGAACTATFAGGTLGINRDTTNAGTVNWTAGNLAGFGGSAITFTNNGTFNAAPSGNNVFSANTTNNTFVNNGTFNKNGAASPSFGGCIFNSTGAVNINAGAMTFSVGGSMSGAMTVAAATTLTHNGGTFTYGVGATLAGTGAWSLSGTEVFNIAFTPGGAVSMAGGTLTLNANQTIANLAMSGGTITGAGNLTLSSVFNWTGGQMAGSGTLTIGAACTATFAGGTLGINRDTTNAGTVNWTQGNLAGFGGSAITFTNNGTFNAAPSGNNVFSANTTNNTFVNSGTFNKTGASTPSFGGCIFNSTGAVNINAGGLTISVGGSMTGAMTVAAGATLTHNGGTFTYGVGATLAGTGAWALSGTEVFNIAFTPAGAVTVSGGTITLNANQSIPNLTMSSGTITGPGNLTLPTVFNWTGGQIAGAGVLTLGAGCTSTFAGGTLGINRNVTNSGTVNWTAGNLAGFGGAAITFTNNGTFNVNPSGNNVFSANTTPNSFVNNGTLNKLGATNVSFSGCALNNGGGGTVNVSAGTLTLSSGGNLAGTWNLSPTTFLVMNAGLFNHTTGSVSGSGTTQFQGGTHDLTGLITVNTLTSIDNTTFTGTGNITFTATTDWNSGTMSGSGTTTIANGVLWAMSTGSTKSLGRTLLNNGRIEHSAGFLSFIGGGHLVNSATKVYKFFGTANFANSGLDNSINNAGVFNKEVPGAITLGAAFNNTGSLNIIDGVFHLDGGGTNTGVRNIALGCVLNYRASYTHGTGSTIQGSGVVNFNGGTQTIASDWTSAGFLQMLSGTLDGAGTLTTTGPFSWGAGTMTGSGAIHISGSNGKLALTTTGSHVLARAIINDSQLHWLNGASTMAGASVTNNAAATFAMLPAGTITPGGGTNVINNAGLLKKMGSGTITLDSPLGGIRVNNTGSLEVRNGTINLNGPISQMAATSLNAGTWTVYPTGTFGFGTGIVRTVGANTTINLYGAGGFSATSAVTTNNGHLNFLLGGVFQTTPFAGTFFNNGTIDLSPDRWFQVNGNFTQGATGILNMDAQTALRSSRLIVSGAAALDGTLAFQFVGGFIPTPGMTFNFLLSGSRTGTFATTTIPSLSVGSGTVGYLATGARLVIA